MADLTRRSLLIRLGAAAAVVAGTTSRVLAQQQDGLIRGEVRRFHSMIPGGGEYHAR